MMIIIDTREKGRLEELLKLKGVEFKKAKLEVGDIALEIDGEIRCAVERKTIEDFLSSILPVRRKSGSVYHRWTQQCERMSNMDYPTYVMVVGTLMEGIEKLKKVDVEIKESFVYANLASVMVRYNIGIILGLQDDLELIDITLKIFQKIKEGKEYQSIRLVKNKIKPIHLLRLFLPNKVAHALLARYLTLHNIARASKEDLKKTPGVGSLMANRIWEMFHQ